MELESHIQMLFNGHTYRLLSYFQYLVVAKCKAIFHFWPTVRKKSITSQKW